MLTEPLTKHDAEARDRERKAATLAMRARDAKRGAPVRVEEPEPQEAQRLPDDVADDHWVYRIAIGVVIAAIIVGAALWLGGCASGFRMGGIAPGGSGGSGAVSTAGM